MYMIDIDNMTKIRLHKDFYQKAKDLISSGKVTDCYGDVEPVEYYIDEQGDLCVDEDMYSEIKERLQI